MLVILDTETMGLDSVKCQLLSLGMILIDDLEREHTFYKEIEFDINNPNFSDKAKELNADLIKSDVPKFPMDLVEKEAINFLNRHTDVKFKVPIGLNISSFDMKFIENQMPDLYKCLGYRSMCLNALMGFYALKTGQDFWGVKQAVQDRVNERMGLKVTHNALEDCRVELEMFRVIDKLFIARTKDSGK